METPSSKPLDRMDVVMPCYIMNDNLVELTKATIASLGDNINLIIVDDCSPMGGGYLRSVADTYVRNKTNLGYASSVNKGLRLSTSKHICISNNDIRISPNWREVTEEVFASDPDIYSCHYRMTTYDAPFEYGNNIITSGKERWCHASFFVINRSRALFEYDETYINTVDDWDYWFTVRKTGFKQAYTDKAQFQHKDGATIPTMPKHTERNAANYEYFKNKWGGMPEELFAKEFPDQMLINYWDGFKL